MEGVFFPALIFDERNLNLQLEVAKDDSMDCDANPCLIDPGVIGPGATLIDYCDLGPGATLSCSSSLKSSNISSVATSLPTNVPNFLTFIESSTRSVLLSIAEPHNITVPSRVHQDRNA